MIAVSGDTGAGMLPSLHQQPSAEGRAENAPGGAVTQALIVTLSKTHEVLGEGDWHLDIVKTPPVYGWPIAKIF
jgi:hypothetical protein